MDPSPGVGRYRLKYFFSRQREGERQKEIDREKDRESCQSL